MTTRSTPFHPEQSPQHVNLPAFSISVPLTGSRNQGLNRQNSDPHNTPNVGGSGVLRATTMPTHIEQASGHKIQRDQQHLSTIPSSNHGDGTTGINNNHHQQHQQPPLPHHHSNQQHYQSNPPLEHAIFDLYAEMRTMLDKMGNLMNVYMSQSRTPGQFTSLPLYNSHQPPHDLASSNGQYLSTSHTAHISSPSHSPSQQLQNQFPPQNQPQYDQHSRKSGQNTGGRGGGSGLSDLSMSHGPTTQQNDQTSQQQQQFHQSQHRLQQQQQHAARFAPDFGDVEDDVVDDHHNRQQQQQQQQQQKHTTNNPNQQHSPTLNNNSDQNGLKMNTPLVANVISSSQSTSSPMRTRDNSNNTSHKSHTDNNSNSANEQQYDSEQQLIRQQLQSLRNQQQQQPNHLQSQLLQLSQNPQSQDQQKQQQPLSPSSSSQNQPVNSSHEQRELQLEAIYNKTNGIPMDSSLPLTHDNDSLSIIDMALLAHNAKANFHGGITTTETVIVVPIEAGVSSLTSTSTTITGPVSTPHPNMTTDSTIKSHQLQPSQSAPTPENINTDLPNTNPRQILQLTTNTTLNFNNSPLYLTPTLSTAPHHHQPSSQQSSNKQPTLTPNQYISPPQQQQQHQQHNVKEQQRHQEATMHFNQLANSNSSYGSVASLPIDDGDDFFAMLMRNNSRDPPQLLSDYNVSKNMTNVYRNPPENNDSLTITTVTTNDQQKTTTPINSTNFHHETPHPMQSPSCPESSPLQVLPPQPPPPQQSSITTSGSTQTTTTSSIITPSLFQDARRFNPQQNITELEFSRIEPVLANLRLCNPHPFPNCASGGSGSGISGTNAGQRSNSGVASTSSATPTASSSQDQHKSIATQPIPDENTDLANATTFTDLQRPSSSSSTQDQTTNSSTIPPSTSPAYRHNTLLPVATVPNVLTVPLLPSQPLSPDLSPQSIQTGQQHEEQQQQTVTAQTLGTATTSTSTTPINNPTTSEQQQQPQQQIPTPSPNPPSQQTPLAQPNSLLSKSVSLLPKRRWDRIRIGIDVGGTLAKICYFAPHHPIPSEVQLKHRLDLYLIAHHPNHTQMQYNASVSSHQQQQGTLSARRAQELEIDSEDLHGTLHFVKFQTTSIKHFFDLVNLEGLGRVELFATGGGAHKYRQDFLQMVSAKGNTTTDVVLTPESLNDIDDSSNSNDTTKPPLSAPATITDPDRMFQVVDEMSALVRGVAFLIKHSPTAECFSFKRYLFHQELEMYTRTPPAFPFLLVNIGSGVSILRVDNEREYMRVGGSSLGGGTFFGLCRALTGCSSFQEALSLAHKGKGSKVDLLVNDIYGRDYSSLGLSGDTIAASFGKLVKMVDDIPYSNTNNNNTNANNQNHNHRGESFNPYDYGITREDLAKSALVMITNNICSLAHLYARQVLKIPSVVFVGNFLRNNILAMRMLSYALAYWSNNSIEAIFLKHEGYFGAVGTFFDDDDALNM